MDSQEIKFGSGGGRSSPLTLTWCLQLMLCMCIHVFLLQRISPHSPGASQTQRVEDLQAVPCIAGMALEKIP